MGDSQEDLSPDGLDGLLARLQSSMGARFPRAFASLRVVVNHPDSPEWAQVAYIGPGLGGKAGFFFVSYPSCPEALPSLRPVVGAPSSLSGVQEKLAVLEAIPDLVDTIVLEGTPVPNNLQEIYVLEDGETWSSVPPVPVRVTKEQLDRIEGGEKVRDVVGAPSYYEECCYAPVDMGHAFGCPHSTENDADQIPLHLKW